ncbi:unnamed protein product, partial [Musa acuminata subsp. burmannicoides]
MLSHANVSRAWACFEHSNFFKVTAPEARPGQLRPGTHRRQKGWDDRCTPEADRPTVPKSNSELLAQQLKYTLLELELPRLLAPDLPSNGSSLRDLDCTHSNYQTRRARYCYLLSLPPVSGLGN